MKSTLTYFKNSNTNEMIIRQVISDSDNSTLKIMPSTYFYNSNNQEIEMPNLSGFVEIKEKTFKRECKRQKLCKY